LTLANVKAKDYGTYHVEIEAEPFRSLKMAALSRTALLVDGETGIVSGSLLREVFQDISGNFVDQLTKSDKYQSSNPDFIDTIGSFEAPKDFDENYGQRISGYLLPPRTGEYVFYLASDDGSELFISSDDSPAYSKLEASVRVVAPAMSIRGWQERSAAVSRPIQLEAGKRYAVKVLMKEGRWGDHLAVAWQMPGDPPPKAGDPPIPGKYLEFDWNVLLANETKNAEAIGE